MTSSAWATAASSSADQRWNRPWCGVRPRPTRSTTVTPSGAMGFWGSSPSVRATSLVGMPWIDFPSSSTSPPRGLSSRAIPRSRVDLPQALAPTMTVTLPWGSSALTPSTTTRSS